MFKKFRFSYLILFAIVLFTATENCYAATRYWFNYDSTLMSGLCTDNGVSLGCKVKCKSTNSVSDYTTTTNTPFGDCISYDDVSQFSYFKTYDKISDFRDILSGFTCGSDNCYKYVASTYCNNFKKNESVCTALKNAKEESAVSSDGRTCIVNMIAMSNKDLLKSSDEKKLIIFIPSEKSKNPFSIHYGSLDNGNGVELSNNSISFSGNNFYFYGKGSNFATFKKDYIAAAGGVNGTKCPDVTFCLDDASEKTWYAEMNDNFDSSKYTSGICQTSSNGLNEGLKLREDEPHPGQNLINENKISILDCKALLGGDGTNTSLVDLLKTGLNVIKIIVPIILIVLGSLDFAQAVFASNEDAIKKAQSKFVKRLIIAAVIFLIPSVLKVILQLANSIWGNIDPDFCGILD